MILLVPPLVARDPGPDQATSASLLSPCEEEQPVYGHGGGIFEVGAGRGVQFVQLLRAH
jgi:hypothetical protein